jgi:hypothetical protein
MLRRQQKREQALPELLREQSGYPACVGAARGWRVNARKVAGVERRHGFGRRERL